MLRIETHHNHNHFAPSSFHHGQEPQRTNMFNRLRNKFSSNKTSSNVAMNQSQHSVASLNTKNPYLNI
ncbi:hypothetical protein FZEAL_10809, partial [Fusarium zealandicum]